MLTRLKSAHLTFYSRKRKDECFAISTFDRVSQDNQTNRMDPIGHPESRINRGPYASHGTIEFTHLKGIMAMLIQDPQIDKTKIIKMAIVHDLAEAKVGDITPHDGISDDQKHQLERDAINDMVQMLNHSPQILEIQSLWEEYEHATTPEALLVKDLDKFEMISQALEYEQRTCFIY